MSHRVRYLAATALLLSACDGVIGALDGEKPPDPVDPTQPTLPTPEQLACDVAQFPSVTLDGIAAEFDQRVYPRLTSTDRGCDACHGVASGRPFLVMASGTETFHKALAAGFFRDDPRSLLARLVSTDAASRMPRGAGAWDAADVIEVARIGCMARAYEANGGTPPDEQFPPDLLTPYTGAPSPNYDNTFINYAQLKNKVRAVFADDWVRGGEDRFEKNIGLFGGVNFTTHFVEARAATAEFLLGLDVLAPEVCRAAVTAHTGPFADLDVSQPLIDVPASSTRTTEIETLTPTPATGAGNASSNPAGYFCYTNCSFTVNVDLPAPGDYQVVVRGKPTLDGNGDGPEIRVQVGTVTAASNLLFLNAAAYEEKTATVTVTQAGMTPVSIAFVNDAVVNGGDRNIYLDYFKVVGPLGSGTGTTRETLAKSNIDALYQKVLFRPATAQDQADGYALLKDLTQLGPLPDAWSGLCEALVRHPDFLFLLPPSFDTTTDAATKDRLRTVALTQHLLGRPPTAAEFTRLSASGFAAVVDDALASPDFRAWYFNRMRLRIEATGSAESDEPARLWTYLAVNERPFRELLVGDYSVDENFQRVARPATHGQTGVLTMKGYLNNKPGLPHYNYPARVLSGFMGNVFEVPPEVFDQRGTATATSTVDPNSVCFSCHQLLTPLAHQRLAWDDNGDYRTTMPDGAPVDDSDRGLVASYPYPGKGLEAFSTKAVKKEAFVRRMLNTHFKLLMGRDLRWADDERVLYKTLWDLSAATDGNLKAILRGIALSDTFQRKTTP